MGALGEISALTLFILADNCYKMWLGIISGLKLVFGQLQPADML